LDEGLDYPRGVIAEVPYLVVIARCWDDERFRVVEAVSVPPGRLDLNSDTVDNIQDMKAVVCDVVCTRATFHHQAMYLKETVR
jgi:hypothetical protein